jgi:hypothetical protein
MKVELQRGCAPSIQPGGRIELLGPADLDHIEFTGERRLERQIGRLALHDAADRLIKRRQAAGADDGD